MKQKMNVVMVLADQLNANWLGCAGHPQALTPRLDAFAATGMRFDSAYCQNPICTPSRVSILSGQYCHNHGYYGLSGPAPAKLDNLFRHFRRHGYRTAAYGKLHLPEAPRNWIADDVDEFGDTYETADGVFGESEFLDGLERKGLRDLEDSWHNENNYGKPSIAIDAMPSQLPLEETQEMWCVRKAMDFMQQDHEQPFCIQVAFQKPHHPLLPNERFWNLYPEDLDLPSTWDLSPETRPPHFQQRWEEWREYQPEFGREGDSFEDFVRRSWRGTLACVSQIDYVFGQLLDFLKSSGLEENTIVVFGSDHGAYHGHYGILEKAPGICSDAVCRVPMLWRVPGVTSAGKASRQLVENVDMAPTLSSLCGLPSMEMADGCDISSLLAGSSDAVREIAVTENVWSKALRWENWRFVHYQQKAFAGQDVGELYDIENDPEETRNLYHDEERRELIETCRRKLLEWLIETQRAVTTQQTVKYENYPPYQKGARFTYPYCGDGLAPNCVQARHREGIGMYL
ncbi:MAG: sulfatase-like hydrolase/transferase [Verrucomicrobiota bacterium JB024]|nr:sulfatase-like hydrolase/transferase [Verrucomicrobiota bacterium JB024]